MRQIGDELQILTSKYFDIIGWSTPLAYKYNPIGTTRQGEMAERSTRQRPTVLAGMNNLLHQVLMVNNERDCLLKRLRCQNKGQRIRFTPRTNHITQSIWKGVEMSNYILMLNFICYFIIFQYSSDLYRNCGKIQQQFI